MDKKELIDWINENVFTEDKKSKDKTWDLTVRKYAEVVINSIIEKKGEVWSPYVIEELKQLFNEVISITENFLIKNGVELQQDKNNFNRSICQLFLLKIVKFFEYDGKIVTYCPRCKKRIEFDLTKVPVKTKFDTRCDCGANIYFMF